jgi:histidinol-phosphate/aromatic aminotransferase/cobyric acid decarboxylase-like protein
VTNGISRAIDDVCAAFSAPKDVVVMETPTYYHAAKIFLDHHLEVVTNNNNYNKPAYAGTNDCFTHVRVLLVLQAPRH